MDRSVPENIIYHSTGNIEIKINDSALEGIRLSKRVWWCGSVSIHVTGLALRFSNDVCAAVSPTHHAIIPVFQHSAIQLQNIFQSNNI